MSILNYLYLTEKFAVIGSGEYITGFHLNSHKKRPSVQKSTQFYSNKMPTGAENQTSIKSNEPNMVTGKFFYFNNQNY